MENNLEELQELITTIETTEKTEELVEWMKEISAKEYGLIDSLILTFMENLSNITFANSVLRVLKILNDSIPELVLSQMRENTNFPKAITKYLSTAGVKELEGDGFILLVEIFQASSFKDVASEAFINTIFEVFPILNDEAIWLALISILVSISNESESFEKNLVLKACAEHPNRRFFAEGFLLLLNKAQSVILAKSLKFTQDILQNSKTKDEFFYTNDCTALMTILIREIGNVSEDDIRYMYLNVLAALIATEFYKKEKHRSSDIKELLSNCQFIDDISPNTQKKVQEIVDSGLV